MSILYIIAIIILYVLCLLSYCGQLLEAADFFFLDIPFGERRTSPNALQIIMKRSSLIILRYFTSQAVGGILFYFMYSFSSPAPGGGKFTLIVYILLALSNGFLSIALIVYGVKELKN